MSSNDPLTHRVFLLKVIDGDRRATILWRDDAMKIHSVILENFRAYKDRTEIPFSQFTSFIGKNDVGKSTILHALEIFLTSSYRGMGIGSRMGRRSSGIDDSDINIDSNSRMVRIGVVFYDFPNTISLDPGEQSTMESEYLLNSDKLFEIHKVFEFSKKAVLPKESMFLHAHYPTASAAKDIHQLSRLELRRVVQKRGLESRCDINNRSTMRRAIYKSIGGLNLRMREIPLDRRPRSRVVDYFQMNKPLFALFQSDRSSSDQNPEVQKPLRVALSKALQNLEPKLNEIAQEISEQMRDTARRTIEKLNEEYPEIASGLKLEPAFSNPDWSSVFKIELQSGHKIPLNKRGSGLRRLVLLSFFQAEAESRREKISSLSETHRHIVYAIEEPETSQHPNNQIAIVDALRDLSETGDQVILTTHEPGLAKRCPIEGLCLIDFDPGVKSARAQSGNGSKRVFQQIADTLGVMPDPLDRQGIKVAVLLEGKTDIDALLSFVTVLKRAKKIKNFDDKCIFWTIGGGDSSLQDWCAREYLDRLNVPIVMIQDCDKTAADDTVHAKKRKWLKEMNGKRNTKAFLTRKRSMENYLHPNALARMSNNVLKFPDDTNFDFDNIADALDSLLKSPNRALSKDIASNFFPRDQYQNSLAIDDNRKCKSIICAYLMKHMKASEILERAAYSDRGKGGNEVFQWIQAIQDAIGKT